MITVDDYMDYNMGYLPMYVQNNKVLNAENLTSKALYDAVRKDAEIVLYCLGVSPTKLGYLYWVEAVILMISSGKSHMNICKEVYPVIAKKHNKTSMSVERAMRFSLENSLYFCSTMEDNFVTKHFKVVLMAPKNNLILCEFAELICSEKFQKDKQNLVKSFNI